MFDVQPRFKFKSTDLAGHPLASPSVTMELNTSGFILAESLYAASRFVGWEDVVIGDPRCKAPASIRKGTE
jgi:hypothetical protein